MKNTCDSTDVVILGNVQGSSCSYVIQHCATVLPAGGASVCELEGVYKAARYAFHACDEAVFQEERRVVE